MFDVSDLIKMFCIRKTLFLFSFYMENICILYLQKLFFLVLK
nr:hypothetical protein [Providencia rettgeri]